MPCSGLTSIRALVIAVLLVAQAAMAQTAPGAATAPQAGADQTPLTPRERQLLQRVQELEERLAAVEQRLGNSASEQRQPAQLMPALFPNTPVDSLEPAPAANPGSLQPASAAASASLQPDSRQAKPVVAKDSPAEIVEARTNDGRSSPTQPAASAVSEQDQQGVQQSQPEADKTWGKYTPNLGFKVANTGKGDLSISIYTYARYLNQNALSPTYINGFGQVVPVVRRQDFQLQKLQFKFLGWIMDPKFTYYLWAWTSNPTMGQGAQVVLAGHVDYKFSKQFALGAGIYSLPGTRSVEGNFPFWLSVDTRLIGDEFFRPSYTTGINARGDIAKGLRYQAMLANNTSQLGVSSLELDNGLNTFSGALVWEHGDFGLAWGDFEDHQKLASRIGAHFNRSHETAQSQPGTETIENTQIRLGDGTLIFTPNIFGPGTQVTALDWKMACADVGLKYHGFSFDAEYYWRWLNNFTGPGVAGLAEIRNHGFQLQASAMAIPKTLQVYAGGSMVLGNLGGGYDTRIGTNWFPFKNKVVRWNTEGLLLYRAPVGYTSVPYNVGSTGFVFHTNVEMAF